MNSIYLSGRTNSYGLRGLPDYAGRRGLATYSQDFHVDGGGVYTVTLPTRFTSFAITDSTQQVVATGRTETAAQPVLARLSQGTYTALISTLVPDSQGHMEAMPLWQSSGPDQPPEPS